MSSASSSPLPDAKSDSGPAFDIPRMPTGVIHPELDFIISWSMCKKRPLYSTQNYRESQPRWITSRAAAAAYLNPLYPLDDDERDYFRQQSLRLLSSQVLEEVEDRVTEVFENEFARDVVKVKAMPTIRKKWLRKTRDRVIRALDELIGTDEADTASAGTEK